MHLSWLRPLGQRLSAVALLREGARVTLQVEAIQSILDLDAYQANRQTELGIGCFSSIISLKISCIGFFYICLRYVVRERMITLEFVFMLIE